MDKVSESYAQKILGELRNIKAALQVASSSSKLRKHDADQQENGPNESRDHPESNPLAKMESAKAKPTPPKNGRPNERHYDTVIKFLGINKPIIDFAGLVVLVIYAGLTLWLACTSQQSVNQATIANSEARERFRQDERPYITFALAGSNGQMIVLPSGPHAGEIMFKFTIENFGKTPAIWTGQDTHVALGDDEIRKIPNESGVMQLRHSIVPPTDKPTVYAYSRVISDHIKAGESVSAPSPRAVYGRIEYRDMFPNSPLYSLKFCSILKMDDPNSPPAVISPESDQICLDYNDIK